AFRVDESGAATYSVAIAAAAGTADVVPQIGLNYSSSAGNGLLGLGWSINGLTAISRCRQTLHQDGKAKPITWTDADRFCLDGQRLLVTSGSYGAPGSTYKTEIDSFAKITAVGGSNGNPNYFTVERKDGSVSYYGNDSGTTKSRLDTSAGVALTWAISTFRDSVGNAIWFLYGNDGDGHRIQEVRYAYGNSAGPTGNGARIEFSYDTTARSDPIAGYVAGHAFTTRKRLTAVKSYNGTALLRQYNLSYRAANPGDRLSRLESIEECSSGGCLPKTTFTWQLPQNGFATTASSQVPMSTQDDRAVTDFKQLDINGDGRLDLVWVEPDWDDDGLIHDQYGKYVLANNTGGFGPIQQFFANGHNTSIPFKLAVIDYNADGRQDVLVYMVNEWKIFLSQPMSDGSWSLSGTSLNTTLTSSELVFVDVNSDGLTDAVSAVVVNNVPQINVRYLEKNSSQPVG